MLLMQCINVWSTIWFPEVGCYPKTIMHTYFQMLSFLEVKMIRIINKYFELNLPSIMKGTLHLYTEIILLYMYISGSTDGRLRTRVERSVKTGQGWMRCTHRRLSGFARSIDLEQLAIGFCRSCRDEEDEQSVLQLLCICQVLCQRRNKYLGAYYMDFLEKLSRIDIAV